MQVVPTRNDYVNVMRSDPLGFTVQLLSPLKKPFFNFRREQSLLIQSFASS